ncbi:TIR domain-containing protein [Brevibacillus sp. NPDC058079]|uniref:TIR domain-containing protein n=1 Tax=Brevibacillus sp. NPDC058079 TaxID=3346330 RepID=UPI0036E4AE61
MTYKNKVYICFDADKDMHYYNIMRAWKENENIDFTFANAHDLTNIRLFEEENIKKHLRERMNNTKQLIVLVGESTRYLYKYVRYEIELAIERDIPIIAVNLNKKNGMDEEYCPPLLIDKGFVVHVPFNKDAILSAMNYWIGTNYVKMKQSGKTNLYWSKFANIK